jgi:hypothetical protein
MNAFQRIFREEGVRTFFSGSGPFVNRAMLVGAVQVGTYDQFRDSFRRLGVTQPSLNVFCAAMTSGLLYSVVTMPFETAKNRMCVSLVLPLHFCTTCILFVCPHECPALYVFCIRHIVVDMMLTTTCSDSRLVVLRFVRRAFQKPDPVTHKLPYTSAFQTISSIASRQGVLNLWAGFPPYYLRCGGHTVFMFMAVERLRELYQSSQAL